jgi:hypothetical protein
MDCEKRGAHRRLAKCRVHFGTLSAGGLHMTEPEPIIEAVYRKLGGSRVLGREVASEADLAQLVEAGIPDQSVAAVQGRNFSDREIERFVIPARTRRHRRQSSSRSRSRNRTGWFAWPESKRSADDLAWCRRR